MIVHHELLLHGQRTFVPPLDDARAVRPVFRNRNPERAIRSRDASGMIAGAILKFYLADQRAAGQREFVKVARLCIPIDGGNPQAIGLGFYALNFDPLNVVGPAFQLDDAKQW